ncbi:YncE family protein [Kitasatospora cineracea]|uniref:YncE family protein n=1 Tax=Kitasatospora cineracea TaxID=88074 RepID=UPI003790655A
MARTSTMRRLLVSACALAVALTAPAVAAQARTGAAERPQWVQENEVTFRSQDPAKFEAPLVAEFYPEGSSGSHRGSIDMYDVLGERDGLFRAPDNEPLDTPGYQAPEYDQPQVTGGGELRRAIRLDTGTGRVWNLGAEDLSGTHVWSTDQAGRNKVPLGIEAPPGAETLAVDPAHHVLVTGGDDFLAFLGYDGTPRQLARLAAPGGGAMAVDPAAGRVFVFDGSAEPARLRVFDTTTGKEQKALPLPADTGGVWSIRWDAAGGDVLVPVDGRLLAVHAADGTTRSVALGPSVSSVDIDQDSHRALVGSFDNALYQVDLTTFALEQRYPLPHQAVHVFVNQTTHDVWTVGTIAAGDNGGITGLVKKP